MTQLRTNDEENVVLVSKPVPPAKPPRLLKNKKMLKISSPEIDDEEEEVEEQEEKQNRLYFQLLCQGQCTEVGLSSPNYRAPPVIIPSSSNSDEDDIGKGRKTK